MIPLDTHSASATVSRSSPSYPASNPPISKPPALPQRTVDELRDDAPYMLTPLAACVAELPHAWCLVATRSRREKAMAWELIELQLPYYLPLTDLYTGAGHGRRRVIRPLFAGYMFVCGVEAEGYCRSSPKTCGVQTIGSGSQRQLVRELSSLEIALHANPHLESCPVNRTGQRVRVTAGSFEGVEGRVEKFRDQLGDCRVIINIGLWGGSSVEVDRRNLEPF